MSIEQERTMKRAKFATPVITFTLFGAVCMTGCAPAQHGADAIPASAQTLTSGQNGLVTATPTAAGTIYVYDATSNRVLYVGAVNSGDKVVVDPGASVITINAVTVTEAHLFNDHQYMIKFN
jgi:hypothetical protein